VGIVDPYRFRLRLRLRLRLLLGLGLVALCLAGCQAPPRFLPALDDAPIQPGDVLLVHSSASNEPFERGLKVDADGYLRLPYADRWKVAGKTASELGKQLSQYFSVQRQVTFKIERISREFYQQIPLPPSRKVEFDSPPLRSPKTTSASGQTSR
jgi:hypothetical protein